MSMADPPAEAFALTPSRGSQWLAGRACRWPSPIPCGKLFLLCLSPTADARFRTNFPGMGWASARRVGLRFATHADPASGLLMAGQGVARRGGVYQGGTRSNAAAAPGHPAPLPSTTWPGGATAAVFANTLFPSSRRSATAPSSGPCGAVVRPAGPGTSAPQLAGAGGRPAALGNGGRGQRRRRRWRERRARRAAARHGRRGPVSGWMSSRCRTRPARTTAGCAANSGTASSAGPMAGVRAVAFCPSTRGAAFVGRHAWWADPVAREPTFVGAAGRRAAGGGAEAAAACW